MKTLHSLLEGTVNVYTMDHRGTGRSTLFDCVAAQVTTTGSPKGSKIDPSEVPACAEELQIKYGTLHLFLYGTIFAERLMHLAPPQVTGYVLDSVAATSGAPDDKFFWISRWDFNFHEVGDDFLSLCASDSNCKSRFNDAGELSNSSPSFNLRAALGSALIDSYVRTLIPPVVYRLQRCAAEDLDVLTQFFTTIRDNDKGKTQDKTFTSTLLYNLIVYSELMKSPWPSTSALEARFTQAKMSSEGGAYLLSSQYCAFNQREVGVMCQVPRWQLRLQWYCLDPLTPSKYAKYLLNQLVGEKKELVTFKYTTHATIVTTQMVAGDPWSETCAMKVLASYVRNGGDLDSLDKSCVDEMPAFILITPDYYLESYLGTDDAYDGEYNSSLVSYS
ncbi:hypothetical protein F442_18223 [Phytophthora nicotianae P10297]|uniref:AB hydrolase-1 domain-containing protein n=3 Tax=Phytophthora nicotianae TaxID=4792 RepID=W2YE09_PHYNI|nr:hypothetical protein F442_18223 [Phytophthora nicotianae P10297]